MKCYRSIPQHKLITRKILAVAASTAIMGAAVVAPFSNITVYAEALPDVAGAAATTVGQYLYSIFAASGNSLANHEVNTAMMTELSITMQDLAEEGIITLQGQVYDPNDQEQINEVIQAFGQRTGDIEVNVAQFAQRIQALDSAQTARLEQAAFSLDKLETDPNLSYPDYFVYFSYALAGYLEAGMIEGAKLYEIAMNASDNVIIALDDIHDSIIDFFSPNIINGVDLTFDYTGFDTNSHYFCIVTTETEGARPYFLTIKAPNTVYLAFYQEQYALKIRGCNTTNDTVDIYYADWLRQPSASPTNWLNNIRGKEVKGLLGGGNQYIYNRYGTSNCPQFNNLSETDAYLQSMINDPAVFTSPDIINNNSGNLNQNNMENTAPAINANEGLLPIPTADIAPFEQAVADNNAQQLYPDNADEAELLINPYIVPNTAPAPDPEPGYNPIPDQPTIPEKDPISSEQEQTNLGGTTVGLEDIFPFCIPFDVARIFTAFEANRRAPSLHVPLDQDGNYLDVDLEDFEDAAALLRLLELIAFVVGLALAARALIGARG